MTRGRGLRIAGWILLPLGLVVVVASLLALLGGGGYTTAVNRSDAMQPIYRSGQRIFFESVGSERIRRGDVVLVRVPGRYEGAPVLKRVVGVGGDRVTCCDGGTLTLDGAPLPEPYVKDGDATGGGVMPFDVTVPEGRLFLLGDHRANSYDARFFLDDGHSGTVPLSAVEGRALETPTRPALFGLALLSGVLISLAGGGCALAGWLRGRRRPGAVSVVREPDIRGPERP